jgi:hypothetical protein
MHDCIVKKVATFNIAMCCYMSDVLSVIHSAYFCEMFCMFHFRFSFGQRLVSVSGFWRL